ncbi:MAG: hypothetical protein ACREVT_13730 [Burkholderiales bacterium]
MEKTKATLEIKVVPIWHSRDLRLPKSVIAKDAIGESVVLEEREEGVLLRSKKDKRLSWEETYKDMARERENWSDFEKTTADGLDKKPWLRARSSATGVTSPTLIRPAGGKLRKRGLS